VSAASGALSEVRETVDGLRSHAAAGAEAEGRRLPPLFDPEFLDALKALPPPRLAPGFARLAMARHAVAPLQPFLDDALHRYAERLRAWGEAALKELRAGVAGEAAPVRDPELAALEALVADVDAPGPAHASAGRGAPADAA
jgi:hypothetical protein